MQTTIFFQQDGDITMLVVYVNDMITIGDDGGIAQLKTRFGKKFEIKDLGQLRYFLEIEIARGVEGIVLS
jgi:Reverse transcriptase (RNA-dependent DNA polymerase)